MASQKAVAERLGLSWDEVHAIQERAVKRGLERRKAEPVTRLGVEEKSFTRGHHYLTMVNDLDRSRVLFVAEHRTTQSLDEFWSSLTAEQMGAVEAVAMDMWDPYVTSTLNHLPEAQRKIVFDKVPYRQTSFRSRRSGLAAREQTASRAGRRPPGRHPLRLAAASGTPGSGRQEGIRRSSRQQSEDGAGAALKEAMMAFFEYLYERPARKHYRWWHNWAVRSPLKPMVEKARMIQRRFDNIVTFINHRITNAAGESINSKIQWVKYTARGFRSTKNFVTAIYFHCGGLDLIQTTH